MSYAVQRRRTADVLIERMSEEYKKSTLAQPLKRIEPVSYTDTSQKLITGKNYVNDIMKFHPNFHLQLRRAYEKQSKEKIAIYVILCSMFELLLMNLIGYQMGNQTFFIYPLLFSLLHILGQTCWLLNNRFEVIVFYMMLVWVFQNWVLLQIQRNYLLENPVNQIVGFLYSTFLSLQYYNEYHSGTKMIVPKAMKLFMINNSYFQMYKHNLARSFRFKKLYKVITRDCHLIILCGFISYGLQELSAQYIQTSQNILLPIFFLHIFLVSHLTDLRKTMTKYSINEGLSTYFELMPLYLYPLLLDDCRGMEVEALKYIYSNVYQLDSFQFSEKLLITVEGNKEVDIFQLTIRKFKYTIREMLLTYFERKIIEYSSDLQSALTIFEKVNFDQDRLDQKSIFSDLKLISQRWMVRSKIKQLGHDLLHQFVFFGFFNEVYEKVSKTQNTFDVQVFKKWQELFKMLDQLPKKSVRQMPSGCNKKIYKLKQSISLKIQFLDFYFSIIDQL